MTPLEKAQEILGLDPLPDDAEQQIDALYEQAGDDEKPLFDWIYEGLTHQLNQDPPLK